MIPYIIKSFRGGISDESDKGPAGSFKYGQNLDIHGRDDVLKCASVMASIANTSDLIQFFVPASDGSTYAFGHMGSIYAVSGQENDPAVTFVYNDENGKIRGAAEWKLSDGNNYLVWATATSVARALINGSLDTPWAAGVATQDYKTTLDSVDWHTMAMASGSLMAANGPYVATIDYDGNFDPAKLNVRPGNLIKALLERDDYVILGSTRKDNNEEGHLWSWIVTALSWVQKKKIPVQGVNALIDTELKLLQGGDDGEIFYSDFANVVPVAKIPGGGQVAPGGVSVDNDIAIFGNYGGSSVSYTGIWSYGRRHKDRPNALNFPYRLSATTGGSTATTIGAVAVVNGHVFVSRGVMDDTYSTYSIEGTSGTTLANAIYEGLEFDGGSPHLNKLFESVKITTSPLTNGTSYSVKFKLDKESVWRYAILGNGTTTYSEADSVESIWTVGKAGKIYEVGMELNISGSSSPEIQSITTYIADETQVYG